MKLNQKIIDTSYKLMEMITKGYQWYTDTPEQPFEYTAGSIWLINPETEEWMLELKKSGTLYYYIETTDTFSKYLNMGLSDFESFIKIWVEDVLKKGVVSTALIAGGHTFGVEDVLKKGVVSTRSTWLSSRTTVEDVLKKGVVSTRMSGMMGCCWVEDVLKKGVVSTFWSTTSRNSRVEDALKNGKKWN